MSGMDTVQNLMIAVGLIDKISGPSKGVSASIQKMHDTAKMGFKEIGIGGGTAAGAALGLVKLTQSANDMGNSFSRMSGSGMSDQGLEALKSSADELALQYGVAAIDVVKSAEFMQNNIAGLSEKGVMAFTRNATLLAKAGNIPAEALHDMFKNAATSAGDEMKQMGDAKWADMFASKVEAASRTAKVPIDKLGESMAAMGNLGYNLGMSTSDQLGVLATLQSNGMNAGSAGGAMELMMKKSLIVKQELGFDFTGNDGKLRNISDIVADFQAAAAKKGFNDAQTTAALENLFGKGDASQMMLTLMKNSDKLKENLKAVGEAAGLDNLQSRAKANTDSMDRLGATFEVIKTNLGFTLLPVVELTADALSGMGRAFAFVYSWCPPLRWILAGIVLGVTALTIAWGVMKLVMGMGSMWEALVMKINIVNASLWRANIISGTMTATQKAMAVATWLWSKTLGSAALWTNIMTAATWLWNAALLANPITWVVIGILALIAVIIALIYYWDDVSAAAGWCWDKIVAGALWCWELLKTLVTGYISFWLGSWSLLWDGVSWVFNKIMDNWQGIYDFGKSIVQTLIGWILDRIEGMLGILMKLPFVGEKLQAGLDAVREFAGVNVNQTKIEQPVVGAVTESRRNDVQAGGIRSNVSNKTNNFGGVTINTTAFPGPGDLEDYFALQGG
ncbi:MAG: phage tail tape measure protein [Lentisphaerota bacterium]